MCGGTRATAHTAESRQGLSPRVRGNLIVVLPAISLNRSIPACAGEPTRKASSPLSFSVYPRVCGGTPRRWSGRPQRRGLSPRVRGNPLVAMMAGVLAGSIPACAGEPPDYAGAAAGAKVYPRVCGGTTRSGRRRGRERGLSPRVRGNRRLRRRDSWRRGSIPACAGEPSSRRHIDRKCRVYPRVCGGTSQGRPPSMRARGLSPRVRGNPAGRLLLPLPQRSIPACAGEPIEPVAVNDAQGVYPRVCGGTRHHMELSSRISGLSPRVRGNRAFRA